jgi:NADPH2:quinone reductase
MKAIISTTSGVKVADRPEPKPQSHEIKVKVRAIGVNRIDLVALNAPADQIIGMEWAGEVSEVGADVTRFRIGDRVMGTGAAAYAEYVVTDETRACPLGSSGATSWPTAASLTLALQTMHDALATRGRLTPGASVLIHGATSAMGLVGMQIAKLLGAGTVIGTSSTASRRSQLADFGCDVAVDSSQPDWSQQVLQATGGRGADIVVDQVSGPHFNQCMHAAAIGGRIVNVGRLGGASASFDFNLHALRRLEYIGVTFRTRSREDIQQLNDLMLKDLSEAVGKGAIRLPVHRTYAFEEAAQALNDMKANQHFGKLVLEL